MKIHEITVCFLIGDNWDKPETYKVVNESSNLVEGTININTPLIKAALNTKINSIGTIEKGEKFLLINKVVDYELLDYVDQIEYLKNEKDGKLIEIGYELPRLIANSVKIPHNTISLIKLIISANLNKEELKSSIVLLKELSKYGFNVDDILKKIYSIQRKQNGIAIENIRDVFKLNKISDLYRELKALKKAKLILLKSLTLDRRNVYTLNMLGKISRLSCSYNEAINYYTRALNLRENSYSYNGLGAVYRDVAKLKDAENCYLKSLSLSDQHDLTYAHRGLGAVYFDMEMYLEGKKHFRLAGVNEQYFYVMFLDAKKKNLNKKAVECLRLILEYDKNHVIAKSLLNHEQKC